MGPVANRGDHGAAGDIEGFAGAERPALLQPGPLEAQALDPRLAQDFLGRGEKHEMHPLVLAGLGRVAGIALQRGQVLLAQAPVALGKLLLDRLGHLGRIGERRAVLQGAHLAQLLVGELGLNRPAPPDHVNVGDRRLADRLGGVIHNIARRHLRRGLDQDPGHVDGHVADAHHAHGLGIEIGIEIAEIRVPVVPADELGGAVAARGVAAGHAQGPVARRPKRQHDRIVHLAQLGERHVAPHGDVAVVADLRLQGRAREGPHDVFCALVVGGDTIADQTEGRRKALQDVDLAVDVRLEKGGGGVEAARTGADDGDIDGHTTLSRSRAVTGRAGQKPDPKGDST